MTDSTLEHRQGVSVMALIGKDPVAGGVGKLSVRLVLKGVDTCGPDVWIGVLCAVGCDDDYGEDYQCGVTMTDQR